MDLSEFKILKESDDSYEVQHPKGKPFSLKKSGLSEKAHEVIKKLCKGGMYAEGGEVTPDPLQVTPQYDIPQSLLPNDAYNALNQKPTPQGGGDDISQGAQQPAPNQPEGFLQQKAGGVEQALQNQKGFQTQEAQAMAGQAGAESQALKQVQSQIASMPTQQDIINQNKAKDDALFKAFNDKEIDPDRLWHNKSTGSKISSGIALILGGIGAGLTHGPNVVADMIKNQVERDVEAQKTDQSKAMNAWKMNRESLGNDLAANLATQNQAYTALKYKLMQASTQAGGQVALSRAGAANSLIDQQIAQNRMQMSMIQQGMGLSPKTQGGYSGEDPSVLVPHLIKDPGSQKQAFEEINAAKAVKQNGPAIMEAFDKAATDQRILSGGKLKSGFGVESAYNKKMEALMGPTFQDVEGTVRQAAMDNMAKNTHPAWGDNDETIKAKRDALEGYLKSKSASSSVAKGHNIDLTKFRSTSHDFGGEVKNMNGIPYQKIEGGWKKVEK